MLQAGVGGQQPPGCPGPHQRGLFAGQQLQNQREELELALRRQGAVGLWCVKLAVRIGLGQRHRYVRGWLNLPLPPAELASLTLSSPASGQKERTSAEMVSVQALLAGAAPRVQPQ